MTLLQKFCLINIISVFVIWFSTIALTLRPLKVNLGSVGFFNPILPSAFPISGPAYKMAVNDANALYGDVLNITHSYIAKWWMWTCDPELVENAEDMVADFYYHTKDTADITAFVIPGNKGQYLSIFNYSYPSKLFAKSTTTHQKCAPIPNEVFLAGCNEVFSTNQLATQWNVLHISTSSDNGFVQNRAVNPVWLTLATGSFTNMVKAYVRFLLDHQWTNVYLVWESASSPLFRGISMLLYDKLRKMNDTMQPILRKMDAVKDSVQQQKSLLEEFRKSSRVLLFFGHSNYLRQILILAHDMNMTTDEYIYVGQQTLFHYESLGNFSWRFDDTNDRVAEEAYRRVFLLGAEHLDNQTEVDRQDPILNEWKRESLLQWNYTWNNEPSPYIRVAYASIMMLASVLNDTYITNPNFDFKNGTAVANLFLGRTFQTKTMPVSIGDYGNILVNLTLRFTNPATSDLEVVQIWDGKDERYIHVKNISWPNDQGPPLNRPLCGYTGDDAICLPPNHNKSLIGGVLGAVLGLVVIGTIAAAIVVRQRSARAVLNDRTWILDPLEVAAISLMNASNFTQPRITSHFSMSQLTNSRPRCKFYHGMDVWSKVLNPEPLSKVAVHIIMKLYNESFQLLMQEMRQCNNANINRFIGLYSIAGPAPDQYHIHAVTIWCQRGSLYDLFKTQEFDYVFRASFISNFLDGMLFIHTSRIHYHGSLSGKKCLIDQHFTLKIADFGYCELLPHIQRRVPAGAAVKRSYIPTRYRANKTVRSLWKSVNRSADMYAVGKVLIEILLWGCYENEMKKCDSVLTLPTHQEAAEHLRETTIDPVYDATMTLTVVTDHLAKQCLHNDPSQRPTIKTVHHRIHDILDISHEHHGKVVEKIIRRLEAYSVRLEHEVNLRTAQLTHKKYKNERLLRELLPSVIIAELRKGEHVIAELYESATIFFSDIVGFAPMVATSSPLDVLQLLAHIFKILDNAVASFNVYKVETIGYSYMVASGVPVGNGHEHAKHIAQMAMKMLQQFRSSHTLRRMHLCFKGGINSGPCAAGVVGLNRPRYCLFGDTVNVASRMCSHGEGDRVQLSSHTAIIISTHFADIQLESRGVITVKGRGLMQTFWLVIDRVEDVRKGHEIYTS